MSLLKRGQKVKLELYDAGILIEPDGSQHVAIVAEKRLQIAVTKLFRKIFDDNIQENISVYVDESKWGLSELVRHAVGSPLTSELPEGVLAKQAAIKLSGGKFCIEACFKVLSEMAKKFHIRCLLAGDGRDFVIVRSNSPRARKLTRHSREKVQIAVPKTFLMEEELKLLNKTGWLGEIKLKLVPSSFEISSSDFYTVKEEKELEKALASLGIEALPKNPRSQFDILLENCKSCVETHNSVPTNVELRIRHRIKAGQVRL